MTFRPATPADAEAIAELVRAYDRAHGVLLHVDAYDTTGARRLYHDAGMRETHRIDRWERPAG